MNVRTYMRDVARLPPVSRAVQEAAAVEYAATRSVEARDRLVASCLRLVVWEAYRLAGRAGRGKLADLVQEGNLGLLAAAERFDPERGAAFPTCALWWIRAYQLKFVHLDHRLVRASGNDQRKLFFNLARAPVSGNDAEVAAALGVTAEAVTLARGRLAPEVPLGLDRGETPSEDAQPDDALLAAERRAHAKREVESFARTLDDRERTVLWRRLASEEPETLQRVGDRLGLSRERTRQLEVQVLEKLRRHLGARGGEP